MVCSKQVTPFPPVLMQATIYIPISTIFFCHWLVFFVFLLEQLYLNCTKDVATKATRRVKAPVFQQHFAVYNCPRKGTDMKIEKWQHILPPAHPRGHSVTPVCCQTKGFDQDLLRCWKLMPCDALLPLEEHKAQCRSFIAILGINWDATSLKGRHYQSATNQNVIRLLLIIALRLKWGRLC
jgi:hypothetical protein